MTKINTIILIALIFLLVNKSVFAQHATCNGTRYITEEFSSVDTTENILFGNNTTIGGINQDLFMDIYEPSGDVALVRPTIVLAFEGSFIGGARQDLSWLCDFYTKRGFVTVTFDYRLFDLFAIPTATQTQDVMIKAVSDMKAAVRFLKEDAATTNTYRVDSNLIFVGGLGNGAIIANHLAYLDSTDTMSSAISAALAANGSWTGNSSTNTQYSSTVAGVLNFSGALIDTTYINNNEPPLFSAHDVADGIVPFQNGTLILDIGFSTVPAFTVQGSDLIHQKATIEGIENTLVTIPASSDHLSYFGVNSAIYEDSIKTISCSFLKDIICPVPPNSFSTINQVTCNSYISPSGNYTWTASNTYTDTIPNVAGSDSIITINLTINNVSDLSTTVTSGITINSNNASATYQWLDCDNGHAIITGETGQSFTAPANGNYAVELTESTCVDTSACVAISTVGIIENSFGNKLTVYPNPTKGNFSIDLRSVYETSVVSITDISGKLIDSKTLSQSQVLNLSIKEPAGIYIISVQAEDKKAVVRLIKE